MDWPVVDCHALAASAGTLRLWVGVFDPEAAELSFSLDGAEVVATPVRPLTRAVPEVITQSGVYDLALGPGDRIEHEVVVTARWPSGRREGSPPLRARPLPAAVPDGIGAGFTVLLVSCYFAARRGSASIGALVQNLRGGPHQPDLVLTVGDQVYLDNPPWKAVHVTREGFAEDFDRQYRGNWQGPGYAQVLRSAPVAAVPDDHEYWNNYPQPGVVWPSTWFEKFKGEWREVAKAMFDAYQLAEPETYCYSFDVDPLSFFMMDNRTFRATAAIGQSVPSLAAADLAGYQAWVARVIDSGRTPVLCTGPSLIQPAASAFKGTVGDRNFANYTDYPDVVEGLLRMARAGRTPLLLTGDVHYPRITRATCTGGPDGRLWSELYEVISSPSALVFGDHSPSEPAPSAFKIEGRAETLLCQQWWPGPDEPDLGDHVALLTFRRTATGLTVDPTYWPIDAVGRCRTAPTITLQRFPAAPDPRP